MNNRERKSLNGPLWKKIGDYYYDLWQHKGDFYGAYCYHYPDWQVALMMEEKKLKSRAGETSDDHERSSWARQTLIYPTDSDEFLSRSSGITFVAVQGSDSICMVTGDKVQGTEGLHGFLMEAFEEMSGFGYEYFAGSAEMRPFSLVSVCLDNEDIKEVSNAWAFEQEAIKFLAEEMKNQKTFTYEETIQTAISALHHLHEKKYFESNEIQVCAVRLQEGKEVWEDKKSAVEEVGELLGVVKEKKAAVKETEKNKSDLDIDMIFSLTTKYTFEQICGIGWIF